MNAFSWNNNNHPLMAPPFIQTQGFDQQQMKQNSGMDFNRSYEFSPGGSLQGSSSPIQYQRNSFNGNGGGGGVPFPMDMAATSNCSTPSSTQSNPPSFPLFKQPPQPFSFQNQQSWSGFGCSSSAMGGQCSSQFANQMEYRCGSEIRTSDSLESME